MADANPYPKSRQLARGERRYRRPEWVGGAESLDEARIRAHGGLLWLGAKSVSDPFTMPLSNVTSGHGC